MASDSESDESNNTIEDSDEDFSNPGSDSSSETLPAFTDQTYKKLTKFIELLDSAYSTLYDSEILPSFFEANNISHYHHTLFSFFSSHGSSNQSRLDRLENVLFENQKKKKVSWGAKEDTWRTKNARNVLTTVKTLCNDRIKRIREDYEGWLRLLKIIHTFASMLFFFYCCFPS